MIKNDRVHIADHHHTAPGEVAHVTAVFDDDVNWFEVETERGKRLVIHRSNLYRTQWDRLVSSPLRVGLDYAAPRAA
ncbi:MAG: hypothetical protein R3B72_51860 [Polyangiaceae bacterium]